MTVQKRFVAIAALLSAAVPAGAQSPAKGSNPPIVPFEAPAEPGLRIEAFASGLEHPWGLAFLPDGRMLVTEKAGRLRILTKDGRVGPPVTGIPKVAAVGQGGLLDVAIHPSFQRNGLVYLAHSVGSQGSNRTALSVGKLSGNMLTEVRELWRNPTAKSGGQHFGSRLLWLPDRTLLMSIGDGGNINIKLNEQPIRRHAQNPKAAFGKVLRLTADGTPAKDNPGVGNAKSDWSPVLFTLGHRNIQGLARDPATGAIWASEHGSRGGDELNRLTAGGNFGWPLVTYSREYNGGEIAKEQARAGMLSPVSVWTPSIAPSGLAVYRGKAIPSLDGAILAGGLLSEDVRVIRLNADGTPASERRVKIDARVRDVRVGPDGLVYVLTDEESGRVLRLRPARD